MDLPGKNGLYLIDNIRKISPRTPLLAGSGIHSIRETVEERGVLFIPKPYDNEILLGQIRHLHETNNSSCHGKQSPLD